jgi:hypothetical protein
VFGDFPPSAAWIHEGARVGFEAVFIRRLTRGWRFSGHTTAVEDDRPWTVRYQIGVDRQWRTRRAEAWIWNGDDPTRVSLRHDGAGKWSVNGASASRLDGCMDVDFESSACTNTLPVHRLPGDVGQCEAPAAYVRTADDGVLRGNNVIKYKAEEAVLQLDTGERIELDAVKFEALANAFLDEIRARFV